MPTMHRGSAEDDVLDTHTGGRTRIYGYRGDDILDLSQRGGGAYGGMGDDTFFGGGDGVRQAHMYGGPGHDVFYLNTGDRQAPYGDHVWGNEGADQFHFTTDPTASQRITGRIDDFDHSRDSIWVDGRQIDLRNPPANVRIVQYQSQPWILIDGRILYALEGARQHDGAHDADYANDGDAIEFGNGDSEERHFVDWPRAWQNGVPPSADIPYHDLHAYFPRYEVRSDIEEWLMPGNSYTDGPDLVRGSDESERLIGGDGADTIYGQGGNDLIHGGEYDDRLFGGAGDDSISGGLDNDYIDGGQGADRIYGGGGADTIYGRQGDDYLAGNKGLDVLYGGLGNDTLLGGWTDDTLYGGDGNDVLYAAFPEVFEEIYFTQTAELYGGAGDDTLHGEVNGATYMQGGEGDDHFIMYQRASLEIADFQPGQDYLDLNGLSPGAEWLDANLSEQSREDGTTAMVLALGAFGNITFLGMSEADRAAILASMGQEQEPIGPPLPPTRPAPTDEEDDPEEEEDPQAEEDDGSDKTCFVATACFGGAAHPDVAWLRQFRNKILRRSLAGRAFIATYWVIGPYLARAVHHDSRSGLLMRQVLARLVARGRQIWPGLLRGQD